VAARRKVVVKAAQREAKEETGLDISKLNLLGKYVSRSEGKLDTVYCYYCVAKKGSAININSKEILDAKWFLRSSLADNTSYAVKRCIKLLERRTT
jgi:8-oxo-dGTP pyrophosphatase MutT (NUDIX family)